MKFLVLVSLTAIFVIGGIGMFISIPNTVDFQKSTESTVCVSPEITEKLNDEESYWPTLKSIDFTTVAKCVGKNFVINNLDKDYSIVGEVTSDYYAIEEMLPPNTSVSVVFSLKDNTNSSLDNIEKYRLRFTVSSIDNVEINSITSEIWNDENGWQEIQSPLKDNIESK